MEKAAKLSKILFNTEKVDAAITSIIRNMTYYKSYQDALKIVDVESKIDKTMMIN